MRTKKDQGHAGRFGFADEADEALWATRDYFWALRTGLLDGHGPGSWRSFRAGYAWQGLGSRPDCALRT